MTSRLSVWVNRWLPRPVVRLARTGLLACLDAVDALHGARPPLTPPRRLHHVGSTDEIGREYFRYFLDLAGLQPHHRVLDVGCGTGRKAVPLLDYLDVRGGYIGFDISAPSIAWCCEHIGARNAAFRFIHADVRNAEYNPRGTVEPWEYVFPCDDASQDFVYVGSVFTHMLAREVAHYLREIGRVLKPGGRAMITYFLLDEDTRALMATAASSYDFSHGLDNCFTIDLKTPERAIAYDVDTISALHEHASLRTARIYPGGWCGRDDFLSFQDIVVCDRT